jgi:predicted N-acetyltransferase YhbS
MRTRSSFRHAAFDNLAALWGGFFPERYAVDAQLLRLNTIGCSAFDWGASAIEIESGHLLGFVAIKKSASPDLYLGLDPDQAHLSSLAFREPAAAVDLFAYAKSVLRDRGVYKLVFGQDSRHFFPGCPEDCATLKGFLLVQGFMEGDPVMDFERDLGDYEPPSGSLDALGSWPGSKSAEGDPSVRELAESDVPELDAFLQSEFPGRWRHDTLDKVRLEGTPRFVYGLFVSGRMAGFALTQDASAKAPLGGAVWKQSLGESWGALGPIGVAQGIRGRGLGHALLAASLLGLKRRGVRRVIVDWTTLTDFYGRHGLEVCRTYRPLSLRLD